MVGPIDVKQKGNESTGCCADWGTFDLEFLRPNCISGIGRPDCHGTKGTGVDGMP